MTDSMTDRLGVCSWSLKPQNPRELAERVRRCGVRKVQLALNPLFSDATAANWRDTGTVLRDAGLTVVSGMFGTVGEDYSTLDSIRRTGGVLPDAHWDANLKIAENALRHALDLGAPTITTHAGFIPHDEADPAYGKMLDRLGTIADLYAKESVAFLFETGQETAEDLERFLARLDRPNVGVNFDPANMILYDKGDPIAALRRLLPRVRQVHVKDATRTATPGAWGQEQRVGQGEVDWSAFLKTLRDGGYAGDLIIEREAGDARVEDANAARELITRLSANP